MSQRNVDALSWSQHVPGATVSLILNGRVWVGKRSRKHQLRALHLFGPHPFHRKRPRRMAGK